ncbi:MAG TPA: helix-turn-helix transcriptional regulator [Terriglobales bacterium]|nr:helix-turn-helix transcriptional regulator [Terriglobales bacterium]
MIKRIREDRKISLERLSKACGVSENHLKRIENGHKPSSETLKKIAKVLKVDYAFLKFFVDSALKKRNNTKRNRKKR